MRIWREDSPRSQVWGVLQDCPAGMTVAVIRGDLPLIDPKAIRNALDQMQGLGYVSSESTALGRLWRAVAGMQPPIRRTSADAPPCGTATADAAEPAVADVVDASPPPAASLAPRIPFAGTLDIDAVHRNIAQAKSLPEPGEFLYALYSNGALMIDSQGQRLTLSVENTRRLMHYLDHLRAADVVAGAAL